MSEGGTTREGFANDDEDFEVPNFIRTQQRELEKERRTDSPLLCNEILKTQGEG